MENNVINTSKLRGKIYENNFTYNSLAEKIGMTSKAISFLIQKGDTKVSTLSKICNALGCSIDEIMVEQKQD